MLTSNKISAYFFALFLFTVASVCGYAQGKIKHISKVEKQPITIGFQAGRELLFNSSPLIHSKQNKVHYGINKSLVLRKPLNSHFKLETGLNYASFQNNANNIIAPGKLNNNQYIYSVPVTMQYYFLPAKCKFHPFCGAGLQGNFLDNKNATSTSIGMDVAPQNYIPQADTKYITILFTQGVTFEVNTKIELTQSFHFIPANNNSVIGIDLGIGYKIP